jgi:hypothetical protein
MESTTGKTVFTSNGKVAAAIIAASIGIVLMGVLTFTRKSITDTLVIWQPIAVVGGIWLYGYLAWIASWGILHKVLGRRQKMGNMKIWVAVFFVSLAISTILMEASLKWPRIF